VDQALQAEEAKQAEQVKTLSDVKRPTLDPLAKGS
jgi:hypothetical protein